MDIRKVGIIGRGMIGISNAVLFTGNGIETTVVDIVTEGAIDTYRTYFKDLIDNGLVTEKQAEACEKLLTITSDYSALKDCEVVIESVTERPEIKFKVYEAVEANCPNLKALGSTSSAISPADLAKGVKAKEKIMVVHPYNPPHVVPCVELVKNDFTSEEAVEALTSLLEYCGREVCRMYKPAPGFIANRLQHALYREAVYMVEQGMCGPEDIDKCIRSSWGPRYTAIGLFDHFDYAGLDLIDNIHKYLYPDLCNAATTQKLLTDCIERGDLGYKTGKGIYDWTGRDMDEFRKKTQEPYLKNFSWHLPEA